ncbi:MAG: hypothetical protein QXT84_03525, partial [Candidatus Bathyarchaeia archaeon]
MIMDSPSTIPHFLSSPPSTRACQPPAEFLPNSLQRILGKFHPAKTRNFGDVRLNIIRSECAIASHLSSLADIHLIVR